MKLTTRLGKPTLKVKDLLKHDHGLQGPLKDWDNIKGSELYYGQSYDGTPSWKSFLEEGLNQKIPDLKNQGAAALLFVPISDRFLVYIFGYGLHDLIEGKTEWDFGMKVVLNTINVNGIRSLDSKTIDRKAKSKRVQLATQGAISEFELDIMKDLVSQIAGVSIDSSFAKGLVGSESLMITADLAGSSIIKKSGEIFSRYQQVSYKTNFNWIDFVAPVKDKALKDLLDIELENAVNTAIAADSSEGFTLSYPEIINYFDIDHICYGGFRSYIESDYPDAGNFIEEYRNAGHLVLAHDLNKLTIETYDGNDAHKKSYSFYRSLSCEVEFNKNYYVFTNGVWFKLEKNYYKTVTRFFDHLTARKAEFEGSETTFFGTETGYLQNFAQIEHEVMDQVFYTGAPTKIEYADIVNKNKEIIHVKEGGNASKLSHLFNQGLVSARLMLNDVSFRKDFKKEIKTAAIRSQYDMARFIPSEVTIVFRIIKGGKKFNLSFFSKITLYDTYLKIKQMGYKFKLEWVKY
ncbi:DUF6119 family protein [Pedobacter hartonius]|uniref:Sporadically distributed protein, TIGR04141 family n=1 Tax=Pedobacter hartonius TaxID=425514 RepID=A0A1H4HFI6_9SPHI|nr:DUF6119 family protein [Pedobacter hartonius]SEB20629.1 sporadically distributed protein, TIGR04141 family [Pedobacter hartonius]